jgi:hypothetical protein
MHTAGSFVFDRRLFSWAPGLAFSAWDLADGARILEEADFSPLAYHHGTKEFLSVLPDGTIQLSRLLETE